MTALCPGFVATDMTDWVEGQVPKEEMIQPEDIAEASATYCALRATASCRSSSSSGPGDSEV